MQAKSVITVELTFLTQRTVATFLYRTGAPVCNSSFTPISIVAPISISNLDLPRSQ